MAELHELIEKIENPELRAQIAEAAKRALKHKQFGLVFEEHLPECTPLYDIPVRKGLKVSVRNGKANETYTILKIENGVATCLPKNSKEAVQFAVTDLVTTAELGDPIYPCLQPLGEVCNAPDSELWHTLIEADNYHALQLLEYLYAGKVDCIYIDPPYNTGARDWKYNNDYVDGADEYRHSKWLSFIGRAEEAAFISGDGVDAPHGFLKDAVTGHSTSDITYDDVIRLFFSLDKEYRRNAVWIMNDETALKLRTLKDASGNYLWNHTDNTIMGKPVYISNYMPSEAEGSKPIAIGDFSYYWIIDRMPFTMRRLNELFIAKGQVGYLGYEYLDAKLIRPDAVHVMQITE